MNLFDFPDVRIQSSIGLDQSVHAEIAIVWLVTKIASIGKERVGTIGRSLQCARLPQIEVQYQSIRAPLFDALDLFGRQCPVINSRFADRQRSYPIGDFRVAANIDFVSTGTQIASQFLFTDKVSVDVKSLLFAVIGCRDAVKTFA